MKIDNYLLEIGKIEILTKEKEAEFTRRISEGDREATKALVKAYLRVVVSLSKRYKNQGLRLIDLIAEGNLGLVSAVRRFEKFRNFMFSTYAIWWINQYIMLAIAENSLIKALLPNKIGLRDEIDHSFSQLSHKFLREPTVDEISELQSLQPEIIEDAIILFNVKESVKPVSDNWEEQFSRS